MTAGGFSPPSYPYDRLAGLVETASLHEGGAINCSIGTPCDPPSPRVIEALASSGLERGYPTSAGSDELREAASSWIARRFQVSVEADQLAACVGTKEFVASAAGHLSLRTPDKSVVLFPSISYPTYAMGARLAGLEPVEVPVDDGRLRLDEISEEVAARALLIWSNSPSNPTGDLDDLGAVAAWGRERGIVVLSDECYTEFTWVDRPRTILEHGLEGVLAVHSLSKRSNLAGLRVGFYAGDPEIVAYLRSVRQHAGLMVPGPVQRAASVALGDDAHVDAQRGVYSDRLALVAGALRAAGYDASVPDGTFYLWVRRPDHLGDAWTFGAELARRAGLVVSPGDLYGASGGDHVRIAVVQPTERLALVAHRLATT